MIYKGAYDGSASYSIGDVVVFTDGIPYVLYAAAAAGTTCHDTHAWNRLVGPMGDAVVMFHEAFTKVPKNIDDEAITLSTDTADYLITVDDSGDTPELAVTKIEEET